MSPDDSHRPTDDPNGDDMSTRMSDPHLERLLREALDTRARQAAPDDRHPPVIDWRTAPRTRSPWLTPLAVAASIAVVAGGIGIAVRPHRTTATPPATQATVATPGPSPTTRTVRPSPTTSPATSPTSATTTRSGQPSTTPTRTSAPRTSLPVVVPPVVVAPQPVVAAGARLIAPRGYTIRADRSGTVPAVYGERWCFDTTGTADCAFVFVALPTSSTQPLDGDVPGDIGSLDGLCGPASSTGWQLLGYRQTTLGLRPADYRQWRSRCSDGASYDVAQWSVLTPRPFDLVTRVGTPAVRAAMAEVAASATLPAGAGGSRLSDAGIVRAVRPTAAGASVISLDRVVIGSASSDPQTYDYVLPASVIIFDSRQARSLTPNELVGKMVKIHAVGGQVTFGDLVDASGRPI